MVVTVAPESLNAALEILRAAGEDAYVIGEMVEASGEERIEIV